MDTNDKDLLEKMDSTTHSGKVISQELCLLCMNSRNSEVQGEIFTLMFEYPEKVKLPNMVEVNKFFLQYLKQSIINNNETERSYGRFSGADALRAWFQRLWINKKDYETELLQIREMLANLCCLNDPRLTDSLVLVTLEHLFSNEEIVQFFQPWAKHKLLSKVLAETISLSKGFKKK